MTTSQRKAAALALPLVVLLAMVVRAEAIVAMGRSYILPIAGYDPRDLLRGQYLRFRVEWNTYGNRWPEPGEGVCVRESAQRENPVVRFAPQGADENCQAFINPDALQNLNQYFIPEGTGIPLEQAIRERRAEIKVKVGRGGDVIIEDLLLDGEPWQDVVNRASQ